jgi:hypothetical protein
MSTFSSEICGTIWYSKCKGSIKAKANTAYVSIHQNTIWYCKSQISGTKELQISGTKEHKFSGLVPQ